MVSHRELKVQRSRSGVGNVALAPCSMFNLWTSNLTALEVSWLPRLQRSASHDPRPVGRRVLYFEITIEFDHSKAREEMIGVPICSNGAPRRCHFFQPPRPAGLFLTRTSQSPYTQLEGNA